jgi:hypothetical protein
LIQLDDQSDYDRQNTYQKKDFHFFGFFSHIKEKGENILQRTQEK